MSVSSVKNWRAKSPVWGKQTIQKSPTAAVRQLDLLPGIEPGLKTVSVFFTMVRQTLSRSSLRLWVFA
jgi:hypothetical protein